MSPKQRGVSINPEEFSQGGGLNDVDATVKTLRFMTGEDAAELCENLHKYTAYEETLFGVAHFKTSDGDAHESWSAGKLDYFKPSSDGKRAVPVGTAEKLSNSCNLYTLLASIINAGFPRNEFDDDLSIFDTMIVHLINAEQPKRVGLEGGDSKLRTVLTVESIHEDSPVGRGKKPKGKGKASKAKAAESESESDGEDYAEIAADTIVKILTDADGGPVKRTSVVGRMLKILKKSHPDDFKAIIQATNEEDFFKNLDDVEYDGKNLEIGEGED